MSKVTVVGRGTVGCLAVAHLWRFTDLEIEWVYDPAIPGQAVGEGTTLYLPPYLDSVVGMTYPDTQSTWMTMKTGIFKSGWGSKGDYMHAFPLGSHGLHFNAVALQTLLFERLSELPRVTTVEGTFQPDSFDTEYVMDCSGSPSSFDDYEQIESVPVNACIVFQSDWEHPKFDYTVMEARPHGWAFGIPLQNRWSIGYLFNTGISTKEQVFDDAKDMLHDLGLEPTSNRTLYFSNYRRSVNFTSNRSFNGNASFFLEPMEATSTTLAMHVNQMTLNAWLDGQEAVDEMNKNYAEAVEDVQTMISMHYLAGSVYDTPFWNHAKYIAERHLASVFERNGESVQVLSAMLNGQDTFTSDIGTWGFRSWEQNVSCLGVGDRLLSFVTETGNTPTYESLPHPLSNPS